MNPVPFARSFGRAALITAALALLAATLAPNDADARQRRRAAPQEASSPADEPGGEAQPAKKGSGKSWSSKKTGKQSWNRKGKFGKDPQPAAGRSAIRSLSYAPPAAAAVESIFQPRPAAPPRQQALVSIVTDEVTSTTARVASDMAAGFDNDALRVLPVLGHGSLADLVQLAGANVADLGFLRSDALASLSGDERTAMSARVSYVARLFNEEVHVVASRDLPDVRALDGKRVGVGTQGSASAVTAQIIFDRLGIAPQFVYLDQSAALEKLKSGDIAATLMIGGRPIRALQDFGSDGHFSLLPIPYEAALQDLYMPSKIEAADYGNLIPRNAQVPTLAVGILLATVDAPEGSPRAARVARVTEALFNNIATMRDPTRHPKWREVNLAANVPNWTRFRTAQDILDREKSGIAAAGPADANAGAKP